MKKIIFYFLAIIVFVSCDQKNEKTMYDFNDKDLVSVGTPLIDSPIALNAGNEYSISFPIYRGDLRRTTIANVTLTADDIWQLGSNTVSFSAGEGTTYVKIKANNNANIKPGKTYQFKLTLDGDDVSTLYNEANFKAILELEYTELGSGSFTDNWNETGGTAIKLFQAQGFDVTKAKDLFAKDFDILFVEDLLNSTVEIPAQNGWHHTGVDLPVKVRGTGTITVDGQGKKVYTLSIEHYLPQYNHSWGKTPEIITFP